MRVLAVIHYATWGGPHNRCLCLAPLLKSRGIELSVLLPDEPGDAPQRFHNAGVETVQIPLQRLRRSFQPSVHARHLRNFSSDVRTIRGLLRERGIDLVLIFGLGNLQGAIAAKLENRPLVWQLIDVGYPMIIRLLAMPVVTRLADVLMTTGKKVARAHPGAASFGDRLVTFFPPVDVELFKAHAERRAAARLELGIGPDQVVVGTVGNINAQKNHASFIRAAAQLKREFPKTCFVILGTTLENRRRFAEGLWRQAEELGLELDNDLIVRNPGARVCDLAQSFDIFWLTSLWEGIPTAVEEAMSLSIPVVTTDVGSVREAIEDGVTGFMVPARDEQALVRATVPLIEMPALRSSIGEQARRCAVQRFHVNICADLHARAFERAMANGASRAALAS